MIRRCAITGLTALGITLGSASAQTMHLSGDIAAPMKLVSNTLWSAIVTLPAPRQSLSFVFSADSGASVWGDASQEVNTLPLYGAATTGNTPIAISQTVTGTLVFAFDTVTLDYTVQQAVAVDFNNWAVTNVFRNFTNQNWSVINGRVIDTGAVYEARSLLLSGTGVTPVVRSPLLAEGVGDIAFMFRNAATNGVPDASFTVETSPDNALWTIVASRSAIRNTDYRLSRIELNNRNARFVRIVSSGAAPRGELAIDDLSVAAPGAGLAFSSVAISPPEPSTTNPVIIRVNVNPLIGATLTSLAVQYENRSMIYTRIPMTLESGNTYVTTQPVPGGMGKNTGGTGPVNFFFDARFTGFRSPQGSPVLHPFGGSANPLTYNVISASVSITNVAPFPVTAPTDTPVHIDADFIPRGGAFDVAGTLHYRVGASGAWTSLAMSDPESDGRHRTVSGLELPRTPGVTIFYYITVTLKGPGATSVQHPVGGAASPASFVLTAPIHTSAFSSMRVIDGYSAAMSLVGQGIWHGVDEDGGANNAAFRFRANESTPIFGDSTPSGSALPIYGVAATSGPAVVIGGAQPHSIAFRLNENNRQYYAQRAHFDSYNSGTAKDWMEFASVSTTSPADVARQRHGRYLIILDGGYVYPNVTPQGGVGEISFWYRKRDADPNRPTRFSVNVWSTFGTNEGYYAVYSISNIVATNWMYQSIVVSDPNATHIDILCTSGASGDALCIDDLTITAPGPRPTFSNFSITPSAPTLLNIVTVRLDIATSTPVGNVQSILHYRPRGSTGAFSSVTMLPTTGNTYQGTLSQLGLGDFEYYIEITYTAMTSDQRIRAWHPRPPMRRFENNVDVPIPLPFFTVSDFSVSQNFDSAAWSINPSEKTNRVFEGWTVWGARMDGGVATPSSPPRAAWLEDSGSFVMTPHLTNVIGNLSFELSRRGAETLTFDVDFSADGTNWTRLTSRTMNVATWTYQVVPVDRLTPGWLRIRLTGSPGTSLLGVDNVRVSVPPARVDISEVMIHPGYPSQGEPVHISCTIRSVGPVLFASHIQAQVFYRRSSDTSFLGPIPMIAVGSRFTTATPIPGIYAADERIQYYIRATFNGYSFNARESRSPSFHPDPIANLTGPAETFFGGAGSLLFFDIRPFPSEYQSVIMQSSAGNLPLTLVGNHEWQGFFNLAAVTNATLNWVFVGTGLFEPNATGYATNLIVYGDPNQVRGVFPFSGVALESNHPIYAEGPFFGTAMIRFNTQTHAYRALLAAYQNFDAWIADPQFFDQSISSEKLHVDWTGFTGWPLSADIEPAPGVRRTIYEIGPVLPDNVGSGWEALSSYQTSPFFGSDGWQADRALILREIDSKSFSRGHHHRPNEGLRLEPSVGMTWPTRSTGIHGGQGSGVGTFSFQARTVFEDSHLTWWNVPATNMLNYQFSVQITTPTIAPDNPYVDTYFRFQDSDTHYICRFVRHDSSWTHMQMFYRDGTTRASPTPSHAVWVHRDFAGTATLTITVSQGNNDSVAVLAQMLDSANNIQTLEADFTGVNRILQPGTIGFMPYGCDVMIDHISMRRVVIQRFQNRTDRENTDIWYDDNAGWAGWHLNKYHVLNQDGSFRCKLRRNDGVALSPALGFTPGHLSFVYRNQDTTTGSGTSVLRIEGRTNMVWTTIQSLSFTDTNTNRWDSTELGRSVTGFTQFRISNVSTNRDIWIDNILIREDRAYREATFPNSAALAEWQAPTNTWRFSAGQYARAGYLPPSPVTYKLQWALTNEVNEGGIGTYTDIPGATGVVSSLGWVPISHTINQPDHRLVRLIQTSSGASLVVDDVGYTSHRARRIPQPNVTNEANGWLALDGWVVNVGDPRGTALSFPASRRGTTAAADRGGGEPATHLQALRSPLLTNGIGTLEFEYRVDNGPATMIIEAAPVETPSTYSILLYSNQHSQTGWTRFSESYRTSQPAYIRIRHFSPTNNVTLFIDNVTATENRTRTLTEWEAYNALISDNVRRFRGKSCTLNNSPSLGTAGDQHFGVDLAYLETPLLPNGLGELSFNFRREASQNARLSIRVSDDFTRPADQWTSILEITATTTNWTRFSTNIFLPDAKFVRFYCNTNMAPGRVMLDEILVTEPVGANLDIVDVTLSPDIPLTGDRIGMRAKLSNFLLQPNIRNVRVYYYFGESPWGTWTNSPVRSFELEFDVNASDSFASFYFTPPGQGIPAQTIPDTLIQYRIEAEFTGLFAERSSPKGYTRFRPPPWYYPVDLNAKHAPRFSPYLYVLSSRPGDVWINEFYYASMSSLSQPNSEFIEICGVANVDIANWRIELVDTPRTDTDAAYAIYTNTVMTRIPLDLTNGYGFLVLGDAGVANVDIPFTHWSGLNFQLPRAHGGIRLVRPMGAYAHAVAYGNAVPGYEHAGQQPTGTGIRPIGSLYLWGTGTNRTGFAWTFDSQTPRTPGAANTLQFLSPRNQLPPGQVDVVITDVTYNRSTGRVTVTVGNPDGAGTWRLHYATNLLSQSPWMPVPSWTVDSSNPYRATFEPIEGAPLVFYMFK